MKKIHLLAVILSIIAVFGLSRTTLAQDIRPDFDPNYIISDAEIFNYNAMDAQDIQNFLQSKGSYLAAYTVTNPNTGVCETAAQAIYEVCQANKISPRFVLVLLQKEQGLIEDPNPSQGSLDWATGYGCPDGGGCNSRWQGFWKQINSATLQFYDYMVNPFEYGYRPGNTYTFNNTCSAYNNPPSSLVTPYNLATAALYNYTPHVFNGNYNFYTLWQKYFARNYPDGSLLQIKGDKTVWLIQDGKKRAFSSPSVLASRFNINKIITVEKADMDKFGTSTPIRFSNYSLIRSPRGTVYLLVDDQKRGFTSKAVFKKFGYNPAEVVAAGWNDINSYPEGVPLTATSTYPAGALLQDSKTGGVYWVYEGKKAPIPDKAVLTNKFKNKKIIKAAAAELAQYPTTDPILFGDGELLKSSNSPAIYLIAGGVKRPFMSSDLLVKLGYKLSNIINVSPQFLANYNNGEVIKENNF
ncbi:MAG: hypothetical protein PHO56_01935 [Patescibacteria group bacterium]|nr:hypothetical protein [Patescibacteria group bacterium]